MSPASDKHEANVARGLKAAIHNPRVSDEAKEHAKERLEDMGVAVEAENGEHTNRASGGHKAARAEERTSDENEDEADASSEPSDSGTVKRDQHESNRLRGYKAALHNPHVSDEAKENAKKVLQDHDAL
ncbi:hypothetical protein Moror_11042 [Moniliophthora roreri MCA 2997]|uniref:Conidiation-specific protein 6 n=2 Tax=Moniliophthora roreri TaxID=221103 RepID=V2WXX0_MONRO|nr:hypothetical protein Moror_11042 [Moniliophthora roreri MCA 2997]